jgi:hypothetical protein
VDLMPGMAPRPLAAVESLVVDLMPGMAPRPLAVVGSLVVQAVDLTLGMVLRPLAAEILSVAVVDPCPDHYRV